MLTGKFKIYCFLIIVFISVAAKTSYAQHDADTLRNILITENLKNGFKKINITFNDSTLEMFHKVEPAYINSIFPADLGNIGSAHIPQIFFKRPDNYFTKFIFNKPYKIYLTNYENAVYFNTRRPYTSIMHTTSTKVIDLQTVDFIHTQNVNPDFNFGLKYNFISSLGQFLDQANSLNTVSITSNYKKDKYSVFTAYIYNKFKLQNSGGYIDTLGFDTKVPEHNLKNSNTLLFNQELSVTQKYSFGKYKNLSYRDTIIKVLEPKISISHNLLLSRKYRLYKDEENSENTYYLNYFYRDGAAYDSVAIQSMENKIRAGSENIFEKEHKFGFSFIYYNDWYRIYNFNDYIFLNNTHTFIENKISSEIYTVKNKYIDADIYADYYFSGYRTGDYRIDGNFHKYLFKDKTKSDIKLQLQYTNKKPDYFQNTYYSNHYIWENDFLPEKRTNAGLSFAMPFYNLKFDLNSALIKNYIYYDISSAPAQFDSVITVTSASAEKIFRLKRITFVNKAVWQKSSNDNIISLPELSIFHSTYINIKYENTLLVHLGFELYYSTEYKMYNFNPATGQFYFVNNTKRLAGNYPYVTVFANMKIKRNVMLFFKMLHMNSILNQDFLPYYVNHYPLQNIMFKFGVRWTFKN